MAYSQIYGPAIKFEYDNAGNRYLRHYLPYEIIQYKQGDNNHGIDTSVQKLKNDQFLIRAYPNPVDDYITIENLSWNNDNKVVVKLTDITGKIISSKQFIKAKDNIPFSGLTPGAYMLYYYLNNEMLANWKVIKQ